MEDLPLPLWVMILIPLCLGLAPFVYAAYERWMKFRSTKLTLADGKTSQTAEQAAKHTKKLEERVRVLERIATDRGIDVAEEIEALRDQRETAA